MRDFEKIGFIGAGDPNFYDGTSLMRKELRARMKDEDEGGRCLKNLLDSEECAINEMHQDEIGDMLSDAAPEGFVFEIRPDERGHHHYGYHKKEEANANG